MFLSFNQSFKKKDVIFDYKMMFFLDTNDIFLVNFAQCEIHSKHARTWSCCWPCSSLETTAALAVVASQVIVLPTILLS